MPTVQFRNDKMYGQAISLLYEMGGIFRGKATRQLVVDPGQLQALRQAGLVPEANGVRKRGQKKQMEHIHRPLTAHDRTRHAQIRAAALRDIPPKSETSRKPAPPGIPATIRQAREARGLTWYALAKAAGIPNQATVRDIEQGKDVKYSSLKAVAEALGLNLELVERVAHRALPRQ